MVAFYNKEEFNLKKYKVPVYWQMAGYVTVEANSEEEAFESVKENAESLSLPDNGEYLEGSFEVAESDEYVFEI